MPLTNEWAAEVIKCIVKDHERSHFFDEALHYTAGETGEKIPSLKNADFVLAWLRGDEPRDAQEGLATPAHYADFLLTEWDMYGPQGE